MAGELELPLDSPSSPSESPAPDHPASNSLHDFDVGDAFSAQDSSLFFTSFPAEIRTKILVEAFGDRILHVVHPRDVFTRKFYWTGGECKHPGADPSMWKDEGPVGKCSCIGCRMLETRRENGKFVKYLPTATRAGRIGVMGWLRSCRAAFAEGIDVLYGRNTLHVPCLTLGRDMSHYLPAPYLSSVTSIRWQLGDGYEYHYRDRLPDDIHGADQLARLEHLLLRAMPASLPNLRRFYLCFPHGVSFWDDSKHFKRRYQLYMRDILPLVDRMARHLQLSRGNDFDLEVGVPRSVFHVHFTIGREVGLVFQHPRGLDQDSPPQGQYDIRKRVWRPLLDAAEEGLEWEKMERYVAGLQVKGGEATHTGRGYWLSLTNTDLPIHFMDPDSDSDFYSHLRHQEGSGLDSLDTFERAWNSPCNEIITCPENPDCIKCYY